MNTTPQSVMSQADSLRQELEQLVALYGEHDPYVMLLQQQLARLESATPSESQTRLHLGSRNLQPPLPTPEELVESDLMARRAFLRDRPLSMDESDSSTSPDDKG
jgi:hypothetical protein